MQIDSRALVVQSLALFISLALALFVPAFTLAWLAGWIYLVLFFSFFLGVNAWLYRHNPALLQERLRFSRPNQQGWDKILFPLLLAFPFAWLIFLSLDAVRFHWSPVPLWIQGLGLVVLLCSFYLFF